MKFSCPKCNTRYNIADEKVPAATAVRFTCKKCGNVIRVRRSESAKPADNPDDDKTTVSAPAHKPQAPTAAPPVAAPKAPPAQGSKAPAAQAPKEASTRVVSLAEINALKAASAKAANPFEAEPEWFVLIAGSQRGPLKVSELKAMLEQREIDKRSYVWREGMADWKRMQEVAELSDAAQAAGDAAWRLVTPNEKPAAKPVEATVSMSAAQLQEELAKTRLREEDDEPTAAHKPPPRKPAVQAQPKANLQALLDAARADEAASSSASEAAMPLDVPTSPLKRADFSNDDDDALFNSFVGQPTQDRLPSPFERVPSGPVTMTREPSVQNEPSSGTSPDQPIGDATRVFMTTAGLYSRRRTNRIAGVAAGVSVVLLSGIVTLDLLGIYTVPGMGVVYDVAGLQDPNIERAVERVEEKLSHQEIAPEERVELQQKLMGLQEKAAKKGIAIKKAVVAQPADPAQQQGIEEKKTLTQDERALVADLFADERKKETGIKLVDPGDIQMPNLPEGLTQEAIYKVVSDNTRSMQLCLEESFKKGDKPPSKMEVQLTIAASGTVESADIPNARTSTMAQCTIKRVKNWRFPRFNGEPVTVMFPYVLSQSF